MTLLAPYEQYGPDAFPGVLGGDPVLGASLFDLNADPTEQHNVSTEHPDVVARLANLAARMKAQMPPERPPPWERH